MKSSWFSELNKDRLTIFFLKCLVPHWLVYLAGGSSRSWSSEHLTLSYYEPVSYHVKGYQSWAPIFGPQFPRAHMFQSSGVRLQDDQGNQLLWKAAQQDAHHLQEMRKCKQLFMSCLWTKFMECFHRFRSTSKRRPVLPVVSLQLRLGDTTGRSR